MPETIQQITTELARRLAVWLNQPDDASHGLEELRGRIEALAGTIGAPAKREAIKAISGSEKRILASRRREAANAIASACRPLGIVLEPRAPLQRQVRARSAKPAGPQVAGQASAVGEGQ